MFDNSLGKAAGAWSKYSEISVKRLLEREGESAYFINNMHVRRKDVADIFLGTGLGGRAYAGAILTSRRTSIRELLGLASLRGLISR